jgi:hypothetical protein
MEIRSRWGALGALGLCVVGLCGLVLQPAHALDACVQSKQYSVRGPDGVHVPYEVPGCLITNYPLKGGTDADLRYQTATKWRNIFDQSLIPNFYAGYGQATDTSTVPPNIIHAVVRGTIGLTGVPVRVVNAVEPIPLRRGYPGVQVLTGLVHEDYCTGNLYLPPGWTGSQTAKPNLVISHTGFQVSMIDTFLYSGDAAKFIFDTALSVANQSAGQAVLQVQCGRETIGTNPEVARHVGRFVQRIAQAYNISLKDVALHGMSRGGGLALRWVAELLPYVKNVKLVDSLVPLLSTVDLSFPTGQAYSLASLNYGMDTVAEYALLHMHGSLGLTAYQRSQALLGILCGTTNIARARQACSLDEFYASLPIATLNRLKETHFEITFGAFDSFMPNRNIYHMRELCTRYGLTCRINVVAFGSHGANFFNEVGQYAKWSALLTAGKPIPNDNSTVVYSHAWSKVDSAGTTLFGPLRKTTLNELPLTMVIPSVVVEGVPFQVEVAGPKSSSISLTVRQGSVNLGACNGVLGGAFTCAGGLRIEKTTSNTRLLTVQGHLAGPRLIWELSLRKNGALVPITTTGLLTPACRPVPPTTDVLMDEPYDPFAFFNDAVSYNDGGLRAVGVTNLALPTSCN